MAFWDPPAGSKNFPEIIPSDLIHLSVLPTDLQGRKDKETQGKRREGERGERTAKERASEVMSQKGRDRLSRPP